MIEPIVLADWPLNMVCIKCDKCGRYGQYRKRRLANTFGVLNTLDIVVKRLANCRDENCGVYLPDEGTEEAVTVLLQSNVSPLPK